MPEIFAQHLESGFDECAAQGLIHPLVEMRVKRFRLVQQAGFDFIAGARG